jgi:predicted RNA-binding protein associated with RNAse of E/G family
MPKEKEKVEIVNNNNNSTTKTFYIDVLNKITSNNIITPYSRDRLLDMLNSGNKKNILNLRSTLMTS